jgi:hypothetical protein
VNGKFNQIAAVLAIVAAIVGACWCLYLPPHSGIFGITVPDSLENLLCTANFLKEGRYGFYLNGEFFPSRYLPWFSLSFLAPVMWLFSTDVSSAAYIMFGVALLLILLLLWVGRTLKDWTLGMAAITLALLYPQVVIYSSIAQNDVPYCVLLLALLIVYWHIWNDGVSNRKYLLLFGVLCAWSGALRSTGYPMALLAILIVFRREKDWRKRLDLCSLTLLPTLSVLLATAWYNYCYFGTAFRNGYQYWCPVPYDFPMLIFSASYILQNLQHMLSGWTVYAALYAIVSGFSYYYAVRSGRLANDRQYNLWCATVLFAGLQYLILCALYIPYFYFNERFFMGSVVLLIPVGLKASVELLNLLLRGERGRCFIVTAVLLLALEGEVIACWRAGYFYFYPPQARDEITLLQCCDLILPPDAILLSGCDPARTDYYFIKNSSRRQIPLSRQQEYAGKLIAPTHVAPFKPPPSNALDHINPGLLKTRDCRLAIPFVLSDNQGANHFRELMNQDRAIFITDYRLELLPKEIIKLLNQFKLIRYGRCGSRIVYRINKKD